MPIPPASVILGTAAFAWYVHRKISRAYSRPKYDNHGNALFFRISMDNPLHAIQSARETCNAAQLAKECLKNAPNPPADITEEQESERTKALEALEASLKDCFSSAASIDRAAHSMSASIEQLPHAGLSFWRADGYRAYQDVLHEGYESLDEAHRDEIWDFIEANENSLQKIGYSTPEAQVEFVEKLFAQRHREERQHYAKLHNQADSHYRKEFQRYSALAPIWNQQLRSVYQEAAEHARQKNSDKTDTDENALVSVKPADPQVFPSLKDFKKISMPSLTATWKEDNGKTWLEIKIDKTDQDLQNRPQVKSDVQLLIAGLLADDDTNTPNQDKILNLRSDNPYLLRLAIKEAIKQGCRPENIRAQLLNKRTGGYEAYTIPQWAINQALDKRVEQAKLRQQFNELRKASETAHPAVPQQSIDSSESTPGVTLQ